MIQRKDLSVLFLRGLAAGAFCLPFAALTGCAVEDRGYAPPPPRERVVIDDAPRARDEVVEERYEAAPAEVHVQYERDLGPYGHWVDTPDYGRCWVPDGRREGWRPYSEGHWVDTEQGWSWVSEGDEADWGVVTYHYGRWYQEPRHGWIWVPGTTWAPAWVAWRGGDGYAGWAPLPPQCGIGVNISIGLVDRYCPPDRFVYVDQRYIGEPRVRDHFERNNVTIINKTTNITNITYVNNRIVNRGVAVEDVRRRGGNVQRVQVVEATNVSDARRLRAEGKPVRYSTTLIQHADQANNARLEKQMSHGRAVERANVKAEEHVEAHDRAVNRVDAQKQADAEAHQRAVDRANAEKRLDGQAHDRAVNRVDAQKQADAEAHQRAVDRANAEKKLDGQAHDRAVNRVDAQKQAEAEAHQRAVDRANAEKLKAAQPHERAIERSEAEKKAAGEAHDRAVQRVDTTKDEKAGAHERAVLRNEAKTPEKGAPKPGDKPDDRRRGDQP